MISVATFPTEDILKVNKEKSVHCKTQGRENGRHFYSFQLIKVVQNTFIQNLGMVPEQETALYSTSGFIKVRASLSDELKKCSEIYQEMFNDLCLLFQLEDLGLPLLNVLHYPSLPSWHFPTVTTQSLQKYIYNDIIVCLSHTHKSYHPGNILQVLKFIHKQCIYLF